MATLDNHWFPISSCDNVLSQHHQSFLSRMSRWNTNPLICIQKLNHKSKAWKNTFCYRPPYFRNIPIFMTIFFSYSLPNSGVFNVLWPLPALAPELRRSLLLSSMHNDVALARWRKANKNIWECKSLAPFTLLSKNHEGRGEKLCWILSSWEVHSSGSTRIYRTLH